MHSFPCLRTSLGNEIDAHQAAETALLIEEFD